MEVLSRGSRWAELHPARFFGETFAAADRRSEEARRARREAGLGPDWRPFATLAFFAIVLTALEYVGGSDWFYSALQRWAETDSEWAAVRDAPAEAAWRAKLWWGGWRIGGYIVLPALYVRFVLRERFRDQFLSLRGLREHLWLYGLALLVVIPLVVVVSYDASFQAKYPMYAYAGESWSTLLRWELLYAAQFFGLELFFRGIWLRSLEPAMGSAAIASMLVPYCMIHYGKPWPETVGAIAAGLVLGTLALRGRSIWAGVLVHVTVAVSMDLAALFQTTGLPERW